MEVINIKPTLQVRPKKNAGIPRTLAIMYVSSQKMCVIYVHNYIYMHI